MVHSQSESGVSLRYLGLGSGDVVCYGYRNPNPIVTYIRPIFARPLLPFMNLESSDLLWIQGAIQVHGVQPAEYREDPVYVRVESIEFYGSNCDYVCIIPSHFVTQGTSPSGTNAGRSRREEAIVLIHQYIRCQSADHSLIQSVETSLT